VQSAIFLICAVICKNLKTWHEKRVRECIFGGFLAKFLFAQLPPKRGVLVHKNSLASYQRCITASSHTLWRVLSNKVIWVFGHIQIFRLQVRHSPCCTLFLINCFEIEMVLCRLVSEEVWIDKGFVMWHFLNYCLLQITSSWSLSIGVEMISPMNC